MNVSEFDYHLPEDRIAKYPLADRTAARMMVVHRATGAVTHATVRDFPAQTRKGDIVLFNDARVIPARLRTTSPQGELLLLEQVAPRRWRALARPARRMRIGATVEGAGFIARIVDVADLGIRTVEFHTNPDLDRVGEIPLPPYLGRPAEDLDRERYQTTFAQVPGAVAAPTAGLHFTPELLARAPHAFITLLVGEGTFRDVKTERVEHHVMHAERFYISAQTADAFNRASRRIAVGTTVARTIEAAIDPYGRLHEQSGKTAIFIHPPYQFRAVDALLTNFHLPRSTLLMLVSAFAGLDLTRRAYDIALKEGYRFFSYGDCMLIV